MADANPFDQFDAPPSPLPPRRLPPNWWDHPKYKDAQDAETWGKPREALKGKKGDYVFGTPRPLGPKSRVPDRLDRVPSNVEDIEHGRGIEMDTGNLPRFQSPHGDREEFQRYQRFHNISGDVSDIGGGYALPPGVAQAPRQTEKTDDPWAKYPDADTGHLKEFGFGRPGVPDVFRKSYESRLAPQQATKEYVTEMAVKPTTLARELMTGEANLNDPATMDRAIALGLMITPGVPGTRGLAHEPVPRIERNLPPPKGYRPKVYPIDPDTPTGFTEWSRRADQPPGMAERGGEAGRQVPGEAAARPAAPVAGQPPPKPPGYVEGQAAATGKPAEGGQPLSELEAKRLENEFKRVQRETWIQDEADPRLRARAEQLLDSGESDSFLDAYVRAAQEAEAARPLKFTPSAPDKGQVLRFPGQAAATGKPAEGGPAGPALPTYPPEKPQPPTGEPGGALPPTAPWMLENIRQTVEFADKAGLTPQIAEMARAGKTAKEISVALGGKLNENEIRFVRDHLGIAPAGPQVSIGLGAMPEGPPETAPLSDRTPQHEGRDVEPPEKPPAGVYPIGEPPRKGANVSTFARRKAEDYREAMAEGQRRIEAAFEEAGLAKPQNDRIMAEASRRLRDGLDDNALDAWENAERSIAAHNEHLEAIGLGEENPFAPGSPDYNAFERRRETETLLGDEKVPVVEIIRNPGMFGVGASPATAAKIFAKPGKVNRFVLRKLENIFDRVEGAIKAKRTEVLNDLYKFGVSFRRHAGPSAGGPLRPIAGLNVSQEMRESTFRYGEGDPQIVLTPEEQRFFDEHVQPSRERGNALREEVKALRKKVELTPDLYDEIEEMIKPGYMHRRTIKSARQLLGLDERDPVTGYRSPGFKAPQEKPRKYFAIDDGKGGRRVVYIDQGRMYMVSKTYPQGVLVKERMRGDFKAEKGARLNLAGREWRVEDALSREIEDVGGPEYVKDSIAATRLVELELTRTRDMLRGQLEAQQSLIDQGLASRSNNLPGTENWRKSDAPGFGGLYMPERIRKVVKARSDRLGPSTGENIVWDTLKLVNHKLVGTLFWNPVFHAANVAAHAFIERGWRNINPIADVHYVGHFREAMRDVAQQNENYRRALREGAVLMLGPRRANRMLTNLMFDGIKELQETPQGVGLLKRIQNATGLPTDSIIGAYGRWAGDAMWQMGDILTMAAIKERQAIYRGESLAESIVKVHRELPTYRSPVESVLPGKAGRFIGGAFKDPAVNVAFSFTPYHENILRGMAMIGEDILQGAMHAKDPKARAAAGAAFGKIAAIAGALGVYKYGLDPIAQQMAGQDQMAKRFGPFAYLQLVMDYFEAKHLSRGAQTRLATGGLYSPSPLVEMGANLFSGEHAYSRSAIQPEWPFGSTKTDPLRGKGEGYKVPWSERFKAAAMSGLLPSSQLFEAVEDPRTGIQRALGLTQFRRKTEEEQAAASKARLATPEYRAAAAVRKAAKGPRRRHEDSMPRFSP